MLPPLVLAPAQGSDPAGSPALVPPGFESLLGTLLALPGAVEATAGDASPAPVDVEEPAPPVTPLVADVAPAVAVPRHTGAAVPAPAPDTTLADATLADTTLADATLADTTVANGVQDPGDASGNEAAVTDDAVATGEARAPSTRSTFASGQELTRASTQRVQGTERQVLAETSPPVAAPRGADRPPATGGPPTASTGPAAPARATLAEPAAAPAATAEPATPAGPATPAEHATPAASDTGTPAQPATGPAGSPAAATPSSGLARRVAELVEALEHAPPPRRITVEVGETRLTVSLRGDAVQVSTSGPALPGSWRDELAGGLAQRGLTLAGEQDRERQDRGGGRGWRDSPDDTDAPPARATPRATAGLRL